MPRKKVNWELEWFKIHNPPEQFYFKFGKTVLLSNNLFHTPTVTTNSVLSTKVVEKIFDWESANKISKKRNFEWLDIIKPIVDLLDIPKEKRKELFKYYKETQRPMLLWPMYFIYSVAWGWIFMHTKSLKMSIAIHMLSNLFYTVVAAMGRKIFT